MYYFFYSFSDSLNLNRLKVINLSKCGIIQLIFPERIGCCQVTGLDVKSLRAQLSGFVEKMKVLVFKIRREFKATSIAT